ADKKCEVGRGEKKDKKFFWGVFCLNNGFFSKEPPQDFILSEELRETGRAFPTAGFAPCAFARIRSGVMQVSRKGAKIPPRAGWLRNLYQFPEGLLNFASSISTLFLTSVIFMTMVIASLTCFTVWGILTPSTTL